MTIAENVALQFKTWLYVGLPLTALLAVVLFIYLITHRDHQ